MLRDLQKRLEPLARSSSPFVNEVPRADARDATWVDPRLVGEVEFSARTRDGYVRHPSWRGLRAYREFRSRLRISTFHRNVTLATGSTRGGARRLPSGDRR